MNNILCKDWDRIKVRYSDEAGLDSEAYRMWIKPLEIRAVLGKLMFLKVPNYKCYLVVKEEYLVGLEKYLRSNVEDFDCELIVYESGDAEVESIIDLQNLKTEIDALRNENALLKSQVEKHSKATSEFRRKMFVDSCSELTRTFSALFNNVGDESTVCDNS